MPDQMDSVMTEHHFFAVVNFAAESHVDRSINDPPNFIHTNVIGTSVLLDYARRHGVQRFVQVSTDEVYGSLGPTGKFTEQSPLDPEFALFREQSGRGPSGAGLSPDFRTGSGGDALLE